MDLVEQLRIKVNAYITSNSREWSGFALNIDKMEYQNAISLLVSIEREFVHSIPNPLLTFVQIAPIGKTGGDDGLAGRNL